MTAVRACWAALWSTRALRYMATHDLDPADTAMGILIQPLVSAIASGGGLSETAEGGMLLSATWGLGSAIAQGEVTPDRYELTAQGKLDASSPAARTTRSAACTAPSRSRRSSPNRWSRNRASPARRSKSSRLLHAPHRELHEHAGRDRVGDGQGRLQDAPGAAAAHAGRPQCRTTSGCTTRA